MPLFRATENRREEAWALISLGLVANVQGDYSRAEQVLFAALDLERAIAHGLGIAFAEYTLAFMYRNLGNLKQAERHAQAGIEQFRALQHAWGEGILTVLLGWLMQMRGKPTRARALCRASLAQLQPLGDKRREGFASLGLALCEMDLKQFAAARAHFQDAIALLISVNDVPNLLRCVEGAAALAAQESDPSRAAQLLKSAVALRETFQTPLPPAARPGIARLTEPLAPEIAETKALLLEETLALATRERATTLRASKKQFGGLSTREREITALVAQGKTNREIADALVLAPKTVEAHVTRILNKLTFSSRTQIAVWAASRSLIADAHVKIGN